MEEEEEEPAILVHQVLAKEALALEPEGPKVTEEAEGQDLEVPSSFKQMLR